MAIDYWIRGKLVLTVILLWGRVSVSAQQPIVINLTDAVETYVYTTRRVQMQRLSYETAVMEYEIFKRGLLPSIEFSLNPVSFNRSLRLLQNYDTGKYSSVEEYSNTTYGSVTVSQFIPFTGGTLSVGNSLSYLYEFSNSTNSFSTQPFFVRYNQQLFGGRRTFLYQKEIQDRSYEMALDVYCSEILAEQFTVMQLFLNAYLAKMDVEYYDKAVVIGDKLLKQARLRFGLGKITECEKNVIELQQLNNQMNARQSRDNYDSAVRKFEMELQMEDVQVGELGSIAFPCVMKYEEVLEWATINNPICRRISLQNVNAAYSLYASKISNRFNANISLTYGLNQYSNSFSHAYKHPNQQQAVSLTLTIPVLQWGINRRKLKIAKNNYEAIVSEQESTLEQFYEQVRKCVADYNRCRSLLDIVERRYQLSEQQYEMMTVQFSVGKISAIELSNADKDRQKSKQEYVNILRDMYVNYYQIRQMTMCDIESGRKLKEEIKA